MQKKDNNFNLRPKQWNVPAKEKFRARLAKQLSKSEWLSSSVDVCLLLRFIVKLTETKKDELGIPNKTEGKNENFIVINQSINQSTDSTLNQSIDRPIEHSINQSINR